MTNKIEQAAALILRDICETDPADGPESVSISVKSLELILLNRMEELRALLTNPTESGASDADRKTDDEALQRRHDQERQEYFSDESGASE